MSSDAPRLGSVAGVRLEVDGPCAAVTLCRPDVLNAQTPQMWAELRDIGRRIPGDIRVVTVRGEGRAFSAGIDLAVANGGEFGELAAMEADKASAQISGFQEAFTWLGRPDIVSIAAVQGHAIGAGFQLALACDLRVLTEDAELTMAEVSLGLVPDLGGTKPLAELAGYSRAFEICATGRRVGAAEAYAMGLANVVVPSSDLDDAVRDLTAALLAGSRDAVVEIKALLRGATGRPLDAQLRAEREAQVRRLRDLAGRD